MLGGEDIITRFRGHPCVAFLAGAADTAKGIKDNGLSSFAGFTEFCEKHGGMWALHERGFDVLVIDWPGHGKSGHFGRYRSRSI